MFRKSFATLFLLTLCVLPINDVGHTQQGVTVDNPPLKFNVCIIIDREKPTDKEQELRNYLKREFRALNDVNIVSLESNWHFLWVFSMVEEKTKTGNKTGWVAIAFAMSQAVPKSKLLGKFSPLFTPVYPPIVGAASWHVDRLHDLAIKKTEEFDDYLSNSYRKYLED